MRGLVLALCLVASTPLLAAAPGRARTLEMARAVVRKAKKTQATNVMSGLPEVLADLNADAAFVAAHGRITADNYRKLQLKFSDVLEFPRLRDPALKQKVLRDELEQLREQRPEATQRERLQQLRDRHPGLTQNYLYRIGESLGAREAGDARRASPVTRPGSSVTVREEIDLALRLAPPGVSTKELLAIGNDVLARRGLAPMSGWPALRAKFFSAADAPRLERRNLELAARIVAEYAAAAPLGAGHDAILQAVRRDYPTLRRLGHYLGEWQAAPRDFPELAAFVDGKGRIELSGRGQAPAQPRFLGGWRPERLAESEEHAEALKRSAQLSRIPLSLPLIDRVQARFGKGRALDDSNLLWVTHLYADNYPLLRALRGEGLHPSNAVVVGSPYGSSELVRQAFAKEGIDVRVPSLSTAAYREAVRQAIDAVLARRQRNDKRIVVIDDGGLVADILAEPRYTAARPAFRIVEQTTQGIRVAEQRKTEVPVIAVARSRSKAYEGKFIAEAVVRKMGEGLAAVGGSLKGKTVAVFGAGFIGRPIAEQLGALAGEVLVVETDPDRARELAAQGLRVVSKDQALARADVVVGATGTRSLGLDELRQLKPGAAVLSASSKQVELDMEGLREHAQQEVLPGGAQGLPNVRYRLGGRELLVLGDGWPINLDRGMQGLPLEQIQITLSALYAGVIQAATLKQKQRNRSGIIPLDAELDDYVLREFQRLETKQAPQPAEPWRAQVHETIALAHGVDYQTFAGKVLDPQTGRPVLGLTEERLMELAQAWQESVVRGRGSVESFAEAHQLKPHWVRRLRSVRPELFPKRTAVPSDPEEVKTLAAAWRKDVLGGRMSSAAFLARYTLQPSALSELRRANPGEFQPVSDNGAKGEARIAELAERWKELVVPQKLSAAEFAQRFDITLSTINYHRKRDPSLFPPDHPHKLGEAQILAASKVWKAQVLTGKMTSAAFFDTQPISQKTVSRLRKDRPDLFPSLVTKLSDR